MYGRNLRFATTPLILGLALVLALWGWVSMGAGPGRLLASDKGNPPGGAASPPRAAESEQKYISVRELGELAKWPKPRAVLFLTGRQDGYIEPCGCTGLTNQKGGLARRHSLLQNLRDRQWPVVPLDLGNQVRRFGRQPEIMFLATLKGLDILGYQAVAFGAQDLQLPYATLVDAATSGRLEHKDKPSPFVSANVNLDSEFSAPYRVLDIGGQKLGIVSILGSEAIAQIQIDEIGLAKPAEALQRVVPQLRRARCRWNVLLAHTTLEEAHELARSFPDFQIVVSPRGGTEPPLTADPIPRSRSVSVQIATKGSYVVLVGLFDDPKMPIRYQPIALDAQFPDSPQMLQLLTKYQEELQALGLAELGLKPVVHPRGPHYRFVGSETCGECHTKAYEKWKSTPHAHATVSIAEPTERSAIPRHFDPECLSCHVTGWNPQEFFPYVDGYLDHQASVHLHGNGCENCHGPGSLHVAAERGELELKGGQRERLQEEMRVAKSAQDCMKCHDMDNSPDFHVDGAFDRYWQAIEHYGTD